MAKLEYRTLRVELQESICTLQIHRPEANNTIDDQLVRDCHEVLSRCEDSTTVIVLSGSPEIFCLGADFNKLAAPSPSAAGESASPSALYDLWQRLATGPFVTVAHVRGKTNAGGIGFIAACDIVLADATSTFSLSELLFGLYPACVLPFLVRRVGYQKAHYLTLMTQPIGAQTAHEWGLVDAFDAQSEVLLRRHLLRLRRLSKTAIQRYKRYMEQIRQSVPLAELKQRAVAANLEVFSDPENLAAIARFVDRGVFPWEKP